MARPLTDKQKKFVKEYLVDLNATQAAIRAKYSKKTAKDIACENLAKPDIQKAIQKAQKERAKRVDIKADDVLRELIKLGFSNMNDYMTVNKEGLPILDFGDLTTDQKAALSEVTVDTRRVYNDKDENTDVIEKVRFKLYSKQHALESIAKHLGMFVDNVKVTGDPVQLIINRAPKGGV